MPFWRKTPPSQTNVVECELLDISGRRFTLTVQLHWDVATLKEHIERDTGFPFCLQVLSDKKKRLLNGDILRAVYFESFGDSRFCLFLMCLSFPSQLLQADVQRAWEAFRIHSTDYGDTIPRASLPGVMRYVDLPPCCYQLSDVPTNREWISFDDVISVMGKAKAALVTNASEAVAAEEIAAELDVLESDDPVITKEMFNIMQKMERKELRQGGRRGADGHQPSQGVQSCNAFRENEAASTRWPQRSVFRDGDAASVLISL
eukprot:TRINITY_DN76047_c1_g1_i1.p1 TRINITY_DN76047_c1_g1~~TRINITY_DN76047_c1_g1_i1.p1  ORF type:complete len:261 (-),score=28.23 TRINITY_DN76047_c1_g1_i1:91-873(-)